MSCAEPGRVPAGPRPRPANAATSTLTIATDVKTDSATLRSETSRSTPACSPFQGPMAIAVALTAFLMFPLFGARNRKVRRLLFAMSSAILFAQIALIGMSGCGGRGPKTPKGPYQCRAFPFRTHDHGFWPQPPKGGLKSAPVSRLRGADPHRLSSHACSALASFARSQRTATGNPAIRQ